MLDHTDGGAARPSRPRPAQEVVLGDEVKISGQWRPVLQAVTRGGEVTLTHSPARKTIVEKGAVLQVRGQGRRPRLSDAPPAPGPGPLDPGPGGEADRGQFSPFFLPGQVP